MKLTEFEKIAELLAKQHKIHIKEGETWAANLESKTIFYRKKDIYNLPEDTILGLLLHETAHIHYSTKTIIPKKNEELIHTAYNMLEDIAVEEIISKDYTNAAEILKSTQKTAIDTLLQILSTLKISKHEKAILYGSIKFEDRGFAKAKKDYEKAGEEVNQLMQPEKYNIKNRKKSQNLIPLAEKITELLIQKFGEPTAKDKQRMKDEAKQNTQAQGITKLETTKQKIIKKIGKDTGNAKGIDLTLHVEYIDEIGDKATMLGKNIRKILKINNAMEFGGRYRTGKLKAKRIIKIKTQKDRKPFARKIIKGNKSYAFALTADVSGSMFCGCKPRPIDCTMTALFMVAEALKIARTPRILSIFGYSVAQINQSGKEEIKWNNLVSNENLNKAGNSSTYIEKGIELSTQELKKETAERKIMIILTDGHGHLEDIEEANKKARKENIETILITIGNTQEELNDIFGKQNHLNLPTEDYTKNISNAFLEILKKTITLAKHE